MVSIRKGANTSNSYSERGICKMAWYEKSIFYHIYPLGLCNAPKLNDGGEVVNRLEVLLDWIPHIKEIGCNAIYLGPVFESVGHGYETTDYKMVDRRLGTNDTLRNFVEECHKEEIRVILDGVFNHTGREFFAFKDLQQNREQSRYRDWYCNVNFGGNNEYNDGFCYENWGGYNLLVKLNQRNPEVKEYIYDVIRYWVREFDIDGLRLDAADVLDFDFMKGLRHVANEVKDEFWLMGEVIHGDYARWVNDEMLHAVTNYQLHKALYSGHNDHNYFEIAHNVRRIYEQLRNNNNALKLYSFVDNHDVNRIASKVNNKEHLIPIHYLLYLLPGIPSLYYGSEFGVEGIKENGSDDGIRPAFDIKELKEKNIDNKLVKVIKELGNYRQHNDVLAYGSYDELLLTNRQYAFARKHNGKAVVCAVNNDEQDCTIWVPLKMETEKVVDINTGEQLEIQDGKICVILDKNSGRVFEIN